MAEFEKSLLFNGRYYKESEPIFTVSNRVMRFGDSIVDYMRVGGGNVFFFDEHIDNLKIGMRAMAINIPEKFSGQANVLKDELNKLAVRNKIFKGAIVRLTIFRQDSELLCPIIDTPEYFAQVYPVDDVEMLYKKTGISIKIYDGMRKSLNVLSNFYTLNDASLKSLAARYAKNENVDDVVYLNNKSNVVEGVYSGNIYVVKDNKIYTPPLSDGCFNDVIRMQVFEAAMCSGYEIDSKSLTISDLQSADEIFFCSTRRGISFASAFENRRFFRTAAEKIAQRLSEMYKL